MAVLSFVTVFFLLLAMGCPGIRGDGRCPRPEFYYTGAGINTGGKLPQCPMPQPRQPPSTDIKIDIKDL